jgi:oligo-1,6-glucosidase
MIDEGASSWWKKGTIYQIYPRSFLDSNGDGIGDLEGILQKVDYLSWLGVDAVWLSPIYKSPQKDNGYDISDYYEIDPTFGTLEQFDELVRELRARGIRLIMDLVVNHTSDLHPWFLESRSSATNPKRDWYIWRPPRGKAALGASGDEPTNWESFFSRPAWTLDHNTGEYYLHLFAPEQPDLNWENSEVRSAIYQMMNWWLDRGVGGFRMDVINLISKRYPLEDGLPLDSENGGDGRPWYLHGPRLHEYLREMNDRVFRNREAGLVRIGETPDISIAQAMALSSAEDPLLDMVFQFEHVSLDRAADNWKKPVNTRLKDVYENLVSWQSGLGADGWNSLYFTNHDQPRTVSRFGDDTIENWANSAKTLGTVLYLMRGTAFVYQGDEIGMVNTKFPDLEAFNDVSALEYIRSSLERGIEPQELLNDLRLTSRDNARTPMQWQSGKAAGFTDGVPWLAVNPSSEWLSVESQIRDPGSVLLHFRSIIAFRKSQAAISSGSFINVETSDSQTVMFKRVQDGNTIVVLANLSSRTAVAPRSSFGCAIEVSELSVGEASDQELGPWSSRVWIESVSRGQGRGVSRGFSLDS